jgi:hypothetical protein
MDLRGWITDELGDVRRRLSDQVIAQVPADLRVERPGGGNSIHYGLWHVAVHADMALAVLRAAPPRLAPPVPGCGLEEAENPAVSELPPDAVVRDLDDVLDAVAEWLLTVDPTSLDRPAGGPSILAKSGVPSDSYGWLYRMWDGQPASYFLRWEVVGHLTNHVGEMIATRNRLGLSPF